MQSEQRDQSHRAQHREAAQLQLQSWERALFRPSGVFGGGSSVRRDGVVAKGGTLSIESEVDGDVTFKSPWGLATAPKVTDDAAGGGVIPTSMVAPCVYSFPSKAGATYTISSGGGGASSDVLGATTGHWKMDTTEDFARIRKKCAPVYGSFDVHWQACKALHCLSPKICSRTLMGYSDPDSVLSGRQPATFRLC